MRLIGSVVFGVGVGIFCFMAASLGVEFALRQEDITGWGLLFWGDHWLMRSVVGIVSAALGGFAAGLGAGKAGIWLGLLSSIPSPTLGLVALAAAIRVGADSLYWPAGWWAVLVAVLFLGPASAAISGNFGEKVRNGNPRYYGRPWRPAGIHVLNWLWIWIPYYFLIMDMAVGSIWCATLWYTDRSGVLWAMGESLVFLGTITVGYGAYEGLRILTTASIDGQTAPKAARRVAVSVVAIPAAGMLVRALGLLVLQAKQGLPWWIPL